MSQDGGMKNLALLCLVAVATFTATMNGAEPAAELAARFERDVRPVLVQVCGECHAAKKQEGGLRLDSREAMLRGGDTGPAIEPGHPDNSRLIEAVRYKKIGRASCRERV